MTTTSTWRVPGGGELPPFESSSLTSDVERRRVVVAVVLSPTAAAAAGGQPDKIPSAKREKEKPTGVRRNLPPLATQSGRA